VHSDNNLKMCPVPGFESLSSKKPPRWVKGPELVGYGLHRQTNDQPIEQLVIQTQSVRDLVGFDKDRLGFRSDFVGQVLEVTGEGAGVQVESRGEPFRAVASFPRDIRCHGDVRGHGAD
jgi:hypothetical protein